MLGIFILFIISEITRSLHFCHSSELGRSPQGITQLDFPKHQKSDSTEHPIFDLFIWSAGSNEIIDTTVGPQEKGKWCHHPSGL